MNKHTTFLALFVAAALICGCSRQQSAWQKTREANTTEAYEQFLKKYPSGEFSAQAQARVKEMYEERDWQKARDTDTPEAYQAFLKQYPEGKWTEEAKIRVENFLAQSPAAAGGNAESADNAAGGAAGTTGAGGATAMPSNAEAPAETVKAPRERATTAAATGPTKAAGAGAASTQTAPTAAPRSAPAAAAPRQASAAAAAAPTQHGAYRVQLGAFKAGPDAAERRWQHLKKTYPTLLGGLSPKVLPKKTAAGNLYRLQAVGLSEKHAKDLCSELKSKSQACMVVPG